MQLASLDASVTAALTDLLSSTNADRAAGGEPTGDSPLPNNRNSALFDIDSVYGLAGLVPSAQPWYDFDRYGRWTGRFYLHHRNDGPTQPASLSAYDYRRATGNRGCIQFVPRLRGASRDPAEPDGTACIADGRNDENKLVAQVQSLFMLLHNDCMDRLGPNPGSATAVRRAFDRCMQDVRHIYQTIILTDYLPRILATKELAFIAGEQDEVKVRLEEIRLAHYRKLANYPDRDKQLYSCALSDAAKDSPLMLPIEFAAASHRLGHTQLRDFYELQSGAKRALFAIQAGERGLLGGEPLKPRDRVDWSLFFETERNLAPQRSRPFDQKLVRRIFTLPVHALPKTPKDPNDVLANTVVDTPSERNLPRRNVLRSLEPAKPGQGSVSLATGESVASQIQALYPQLNVPAYSGAGDFGLDPAAFQDGTPLWL